MPTPPKDILQRLLWKAMLMSVLLRLCFSLVLLAPALVYAATLENPGNGSFYSGIRVISGWKCTANDPLTVRFNGGDAIPLAYGNDRSDVRGVGACPSARVGFVSIMNWGNLGDGTHTAVVYDDGVEFDRSTFDVVTTGEPFLRGAVGQCIVPDFPAPNEAARFIWNQPTQHMELAEVGGRELLPVVEECEETTCPVCEVCQTCPDVPANNLAQYNGSWQLRFRYTSAGCTHNPDAVYPVRIANGAMSGSVSDAGLSLSITGAVAPSGTVAGTASARGQLLSVASGTLGSRNGSGRWFNALGCGGSWTVSKR